MNSEDQRPRGRSRALPETTLALFLRTVSLTNLARMLVRIRAQPTQFIVDGFPLSRFKTGRVYALPVSLATLMIVEGWAEPVLESDELTLPDISFNILPHPDRRRRRALTPMRLRQIGIAADRRRRRG